MEPDDLLCSRNARPEKGLVERAPWKIIQTPSLKRKQASLEGAILRECARNPARGTRGLRRPSFDARSGRPNRPPSREGK